jgi:hypothetical protein
MPVFGFTQYFFGAVVFTLNAWSEDVGLCTVKSVAICFFSSTVTRARAYKTYVSVVCVFGQLNSREKKKFPLREKKGTKKMKKNEEQSVLLRRRFRRRRAIITAPSHFTRAQRADERRSGRERERFRSRTGTPRRFFSRKKSRFFPVGGALFALFPTRFFFSK